MSVKTLSINDRTLIEIISDAEDRLESKLNSITSSSGLMDMPIIMSNMWSSNSFPIKGEDSQILYFQKYNEAVQVRAG